MDNTPLPKKTRRWLPIAIGGVVIALLLCVGGIALFAGTIVSATSGPRDTATDYFKAIAAHDWEKASSYDEAATSATPKELEQSWVQTEKQRGRLLSSSVANTNISNDTATVEGTLKFENESAPFTLDMVKVGDSWKLKVRACRS